MSWIFIVIIAHLLNAGAFLVDKFLLVKAVPKAAVYTFAIGALGVFAIVLLPFGYVQPTANEFLFAASAGVLFQLALLFFFSALRWLETSRVVPVVGGGQPLIILAFSALFLGERLTTIELIAFALLVAGSALISIDTHDATPAESIKQRRGWFYAILATFFFSASFTMTKAVFDTQPFISGFVWIRLGAFLFVLLFLLYTPWRRAILAREERPRGKYGALFLGGQLFGALGAVLMNYAISLASVTIVTAMQGLQYAFLFLLAILLGRRYKQLRERLSRTIILRKSSAIILIGIGLLLFAR